jgi:DNA polymerase-3 subunit epsilon
MTQSQRDKIREAFSRLDITDARAQFDLIEDLTGKRIARVQDVSFQSANALLPLLEARVLSSGKKTTGNAWADRQEDTWIDKL